jgi:hypothetical protein
MSALTTWHRKNVKEIAKGVIEIGNIIQNQSPNIKVVISELITRTNTPENRRKVTEVNCYLLKKGVAIYLKKYLKYTIVLMLCDLEIILLQLRSLNLNQNPSW